MIDHLEKDLDKPTMTTFLPDDLKMKVKERLRDVRFLAREIRPVAPLVDGAEAFEGVKPAISSLTRKLSDFSDNALQKLETVAIELLSSDPKAHFMDARAYALDRYTSGALAARSVIFRRDSYFAAKQILRSHGFDNPRVSEALFAEAFRIAARDWSDLDLEEGTSEDVLADSADKAAGLAIAIHRLKPVQAPLYLRENTNGGPMNSAIYIACAVGLAAAVATYHSGQLSSDDPVYASVCAAVEARYLELERAFAASDLETLSRIIKKLVPHLP